MKSKTELPIFFGNAMPFGHDQMEKILFIVKKSFLKILEEMSKSEEISDSDSLLTNLK